MVAAMMVAMALRVVLGGAAAGAAASGAAVAEPVSVPAGTGVVVASWAKAGRDAAIRAAATPANKVSLIFVISIPST